MKKLGNKVKRITRVDEESFTVSLQFVDSTTGNVSLSHIFDHPKGLAAEILRGGMFGSCFIENGALAWPNGFELCPDALRARTVVSSKRASRASSLRKLKPTHRAVTRRS